MSWRDALDDNTQDKVKRAEEKAEQLGHELAPGQEFFEHYWAKAFLVLIALLDDRELPKDAN